TADGTFSDGTLQLKYVVYFPGNPGPTNPANGVLGAFRFQITALERLGANLIIAWKGGNSPFQIQSATDLDASSWRDTGPPVTGRTATIPIEQVPKTFFRIRGQ